MNLSTFQLSLIWLVKIFGKYFLYVNKFLKMRKMISLTELGKTNSTNDILLPPSNTLFPHPPVSIDPLPPPIVFAYIMYTGFWDTIFCLHYWTQETKYETHFFCRKIFSKKTFSVNTKHTLNSRLNDMR